jgi:hypothetical protein
MVHDCAAGVTGAGPAAGGADATAEVGSWTVTVVSRTVTVDGAAVFEEPHALAIIVVTSSGTTTSNGWAGFTAAD